MRRKSIDLSEILNFIDPRNWSLPENASLNPDKVEEPAVDDDADAKAS